MQPFVERLRKLDFRPRTVPVTLFGVVLLAYGLYIFWFGLYGDDWVYLYTYHVKGPLFFAQVVSWVRPFSACVYILFSSLFGENILLYHALLVGLRWVCAALVWWVFKLIWPEQGRQVAVVAFLFAVYPGFRQQAIPLEFMLHFSSLAFFLLSLWLMLKAAQAAAGSRRRFWVLTSLGVFFTAWSIFPVEYFVGLELLRPVLLWLLLRRQTGPGSDWKSLLQQVGLQWLPYLVILGLFLFWRVFIFGFPSYTPVEVVNPVQFVIGLVLQILKDSRIVLMDAWGQVFWFPEITTTTMKYYAIIATALVLTWVYLHNLLKVESQPEGESAAEWSRWGVQAVVVGLFALLVAGWPFWLFKVPVELVFPWDRPMLSFMLGVSLVVAGLVELLIQQRFRPLILACLIGLAVGSHYQNARVYRIEWLKLQDFFWQLSWRAPGLEPNTLLLFDRMELNMVSDNNLTPALNWMYVPELRDNEVPYKFFDISLRYRSQFTGLDDFQDGIPIEHSNASLHFSGSTSDALMVYYDGNYCMRVLQKGDSHLPHLSDLTVKALEISHPEQIIPDAEPPARPPFMGEEPEHGWCYYFQKADLARQVGDWETAALLGSQAFDQDLNTENKTELIPFIEANAHLGNWDEARRLTVEAAEANIAIMPAVCAAWDHLSELLSDASGDISAIKDVGGCE